MPVTADQKRAWSGERSGICSVSLSGRIRSELDLAGASGSPSRSRERGLEDGGSTSRSLRRMHRRITHDCLRTPCPPNLDLSEQLMHSPVEGMGR